jgi:hypothetical protein
MSSCFFAAQFSAHAETVQRVLYWTRLGPMLRGDVPALDKVIDEAAATERFFVALFPHLRQPGEIARLVRTFADCERWQCGRVAWRHHARHDSTLIGMTWRTGSGTRTSIMGFAPLGTMPVTRRAPYVALALWPGHFANPFRKGKPGPVVGFVDGAHGMSKPTHDNIWTSTTVRTRRLLADPPEDRERLRDAAFCLPNEAADAGLPPV